MQMKFDTAMECARQSHGWKAIAVRRWAVWLLAFGLLLPAGTWPNRAMAQEAGRKLKSGPPPELPELARKLNIKGIARVRFTITSDGRVKDVKEVGGNPVLVSALAEAVKKWRYEPASTQNQAEVKFEFQ